MIIVKLWGGLGNQLFQYAYGYMLAKRLKTDLKLDISYYAKQSLRQPIILKLELEYKEIIPEEELPLLVRFFNLKNPNRMIRIPSYSCFPIGNRYKYLKETRFRYDEKLLKFARDNVYIDGYWQCPGYFDEVSDSLLSQFRLSDSSFLEVEDWGEEIRNRNSVAVHVRRGDYVNCRSLFSNLTLMNRNYYDAAISQVGSTIERPYFFFFTDDIAWVKTEYGQLDNSCIVSEIRSCKDIEEFFLMSQCRHQIIANSTFSWWAAWLNRYPGKKIWAPGKGWGNQDILPRGWLPIWVES